MANLLDATRVAGVIVRILERTHAARPAPAVEAVSRALSRVAAGDAADGLGLLGYAQRLAPDDEAVSYAIGLLRLVLGDPRASEPLAMLAARHDTLEVAVHLALARRLVGDADAAVTALGRGLSGNAPGGDPAFRRVAERVTGEALAPGWCGIDNAGRLFLGGPAATWAAGEVAARADGAPLPVTPTEPRARDGVRAATLGEAWRTASMIDVSARGRPLVGSPVDVRRVTRAEGFVEAAEDGGLQGWCWLPGEPHGAPRIRVTSPDGVAAEIVAEEALADLTAFPPFAEPRGFRVAASALPDGEAPLRVTGPHGRALYGSPIRPAGARRAARASARLVAALFPAGAAPPVRPEPPTEPSIAVGPVARRTARAAAPRTHGLAVVIPVHRGVAVTRACIDSVLAARAGERVVVVADAPPEPEMLPMLRAFATTGAVELVEQADNLGFPGSANAGLRRAAGCDVALLNSDTLVPRHWLARLRAATDLAHDIGTATPLSNDATIFSYPAMDVAAPAPSLAEVERLSDLAWAVAGDAVVEVPTGHGFCLFIRADCLAETGLPREDVFAQGYGEENDFCLRARALGWRHVAAAGVYVGHVGSQSFSGPSSSSARDFLVRRNLRTLNRLHPGYDALVRDWIDADTLAPWRRRMDAARLAAEGGGRRAVALVTHDRGGGVLRHVRERAAAFGAGGDTALLLRPKRRDGRTFCAVSTEDDDAYPNLLFALPDEADALLDLLRAARVRLVELHHFIGHDPGLVPTLRRLGCPLDVVVHDYAWFCPRITLVTGGDRYCGEPDVAVCAACVADNGARIDEAISPAALVARSADWLGRARTVVVPSHDTARRMARHFPVAAHLGVWEPEPAGPLVVRQPRRGPRLVCVPGAIGVEKGFPVLLALARHVARAGLPLELVVVGHTCDDARLLDAGVRITGPYEPGGAVALIRAQNADLAFLPSIWPETWSYALSEAWEAGLAVVAFDIGAQAERIRARGGGVLLPTHLPPARLAEVLLTATFTGALAA